MKWSVGEVRKNNFHNFEKNVNKFRPPRDIKLSFP